MNPGSGLRPSVGWCFWGLVDCIASTRTLEKGPPGTVGRTLSARQQHRESWLDSSPERRAVASLC